MSLLLQFIADFALAIYLLCALGVFFSLRAMWAARLERENALFSLEREAAVARAQRAIWALVAFLATAGVGALIDFSVGNASIQPSHQPQLETPVFLDTPTSIVSPTPLTATPTRPPRPSPIVIDTPTPSPTSPPSIPAACPHPGARITSPGVNAIVAGRLEVRGAANIPQFQFYKVEIGVGTNPAQWAYIGGGTQPVEGILLMWDNPGLPPGTYTLRLTVVDQTSNYPPPCEVVIRLQ